MTSDKICSLAEATERAKNWKKQGEKIVFTNGCFDILHLGHADYLEKASKEGSKLIVGLNSDSSVRQLKGSSRPLNPEYARARLLAALQFVDSVVIFEQETPLELILQIMPDVLIKGGDYDLSNIVGAKEVHDNGGKVCTIPLVDGFSTTNILEKTVKSAQAKPKPICIEKFTTKSKRTGRQINGDVRYLNGGTKMHLLIFAHGFKGFKDWGCYDLAANYFAENGFVFAKFNFSHTGYLNGNETDLETFGNNNFSIEADDLASILDYFLAEGNDFARLINQQKVTLIGFSRAVPIVITVGCEDSRVASIVSWSGMSDINLFLPPHEILEKWRETGVFHVKNARTNEILPIYYQFYEDAVKNAERFSVEKNLKNQHKKPLLITHGDADETLPVSMAEDLFDWAQKAEKFIIPGANHTYGAFHPYPNEHLPEDFEKVLCLTVDFCNRLL